jgi:NAD(P)-dependent dehydrogenase (short-subunit alcohol dehydrogenase family)
MHKASIVTSDLSMRDKTVLITGATDGIGRITAEKLASRGATVLIHGRSMSKLQATVDSIKQTTGNMKIFSYQADFNSLLQVNLFADKLMSEHPKLDVLINNAGVGPGASDDKFNRLLSEDGYELRFQVNYLVTVLLCQKLLPALTLAQGRIINIASEAQQSLQLSDLMIEHGFSAPEAYAKSKLAVIMFSFFFAELVKDNNVSVNALNPGSFLNTSMVQQAYGFSAGDAESGALTQLYLACRPELNGVTGKYFSLLQLAKANEQAYDVGVQKALWLHTEKLLRAVLSREAKQI